MEGAIKARASLLACFARGRRVDRLCFREEKVHFVAPLDYDSFECIIKGTLAASFF